MQFVPVSLPATLDALAPPAREQLRVAGRTYDGRDSAAGRLERPLRGEHAIERWDVVDGGGKAVYEVWLLGGDGGSVFFAGTERVVGHIVQFGFTAPEHPEAWRDLAEAAVGSGLPVDFSDDEP